jgi:hypothetical protein
MNTPIPPQPSPLRKESAEFLSPTTTGCRDRPNTRTSSVARETQPSPTSNHHHHLMSLPTSQTSPPRKGSAGFLSPKTTSCRDRPSSRTSPPCLGLSSPRSDFVAFVISKCGFARPPSHPVCSSGQLLNTCGSIYVFPHLSISLWLRSYLGSSSHTGRPPPCYDAFGSRNGPSKAGS